MYIIIIIKPWTYRGPWFKQSVGIIAMDERQLLGDSGGVVNSLDICPASLNSLGCFYFRCVLSLQWKVVTVTDLRILLCQL